MFRNHGDEFNGLVAEIFTGMPLGGHPHGLTLLAVFFSRFTVWKRYFQVLVSQENDQGAVRSCIGSFACGPIVMRTT